MKILITGGAGYIGSHTVLELLRQGHRPLVFDNLERSDGARLRVIEKLANTSIPLFRVDLRKKDDLVACFRENSGIEAVIHFAAYKFVEESEREPLRYYENNVAGTINLLCAMEEFRVQKLVFSSTGGAIYGEPEYAPVDEKHPLRPASVYGHTKLLCEQIIEHAMRNTALRAIALRYFNAAGADSSGMIGEEMKDAQNLIPIVFQAVLGKRGIVQIFGNDYNTKDGTCVRDYIHVSDLAAGHIRALDVLKKGEKWNVFNLGTGQGSTVLEVIQIAEEITGGKIPFEFAPRRAGDIEKSFADVSKAKQELGFEARYGLKEIIQSAWGWYKNLEKV